MKQIIPPKMKYKLQKVDTDQLQDQRKKTTPNPPIKTKNKLQMEIEMDSMATIKRQGQLKQKAQAPIGPAGKIHMNTEVISERPGSTFKLSQPSSMLSLHHQKPSYL